MNLVEAKTRKIEIVSYIIGIVAFMLLGKLIGNNGVAYMAVIIECISLFVLIVGGRSANLISRLLRSRRKKNQYKEAGELFKTIVMIQVIAAFIAAGAYFFMTNLLAVKIFQMPYLEVALKILTPVIMLNVLQNTIIGYFQGIGSHMPTVVSSIFRQLLFLLFGLLLTGRLVDYGTKVSALLNNNDFAGMYGTVALCLAIVISEILVSLFLIIVYIGSDRKKEQQKAENGFQKVESLRERIRAYLLASFVEIPIQLLKKSPFFLGLFFVLRKAESISEMAAAYGLFFKGIVCGSAILILFVMTGMFTNLCKLTGAVKAKDNREIRATIYAGMYYSWSSGWYIAVCLAVLAPLLSRLVDPARIDILEKYYIYGSAVIAVLIVNIYLGMMFKMTGSYRFNLIGLGLYNAVLAASFVFLQFKGMEEIKALCLAGLIGGVVQMIVSFVYAMKKYVLQPDLIRGFVIPMAAAGAMGLVVMLVRNLLSPHVGTLACLLLCVAFSLIIYLAGLIFTRSIREDEVSRLYGPLGRKILGMIIH